MWVVLLITRFGIVGQHSTSSTLGQNDSWKKTVKTGSDMNRKTKYWFWLILTHWSWIYAFLVWRAVWVNPCPYLWPEFVARVIYSAQSLCAGAQGFKSLGHGNVLAYIIMTHSRDLIGCCPKLWPQTLAISMGRDWHKRPVILWPQTLAIGMGRDWPKRRV